MSSTGNDKVWIRFLFNEHLIRPCLLHSCTELFQAGLAGRGEATGPAIACCSPLSSPLELEPWGLSLRLHAGVRLPRVCVSVQTVYSSP